jgi:hypothetical protein
MVIDIGNWYVITVHGIPCPRKTYINGNPIYSTENIFLGMAVNSTAPSYVEYSDLYLTESVINP